MLFVADAAATMGSLVTAMGTAFGQIKDDFFDILAVALPVALAVVGAGLAISLGIKYFRKLAK